MARGKDRCRLRSGLGDEPSPCAADPYDLRSARPCATHRCLAHDLAAKSGACGSALVFDRPVSLHLCAPCAGVASSILGPMRRVARRDDTL